MTFIKMKASALVSLFIITTVAALSINDPKQLNLHGVDRGKNGEEKSSELKWKKPFDLVTSHGVSSKNRLFLIPQGSQSIVSVHKNNGTMDWSWTIPPSLCKTNPRVHGGVQRCFLLDKMEFSEKSQIVASAFSMPGKSDVTFFVLDASDGSLLWSSVLQNDGPSFSFAVEGDILAMTSYTGGHVTAVRMINGNVLWTTKAPSCDGEAKIRAENNAQNFIYSCGFTSSVITADSGKHVQTMKMGDNWIYSHSVRKFYAVQNDTLYAISNVDNEILWEKSVDIMPGFRLVGSGKFGEIIGAYTPNKENPTTYVMTSYLSDGTVGWSTSSFTLTRGSSFSQKFHLTSRGFLWVYNDHILEISVVDGSINRTILAGKHSFLHSGDDDEFYVTSCTDNGSCYISNIKK